ncbi:MAG: glutaminyl-tRNA synthase (glutamine-hydrolyzing) subunit A [Candidatus Wildermuthbacteria bacterium RIFCSPHIGHO2_02_FULL_47_12]|uniref:Glutamyl-tRNA(Gln) amidotransferase subunit A n=1 Tax=Candidatus Wildermuthbacteria bacterium RIFCSPHIGHO2_02_FULL_47_12 TaxID=1802451 RepID=A0A1G2R2V3_9BACT|nr:MAG: glutaminyl-tRNA synthase (glutamine-hydrolyzing) subunit A [Candidatus Wildermuthbacteria bacterium RIFCSPHIGHO2_02_FULL_47_12]
MNTDLSIEDITKGLAEKRFSARELAKEFLDVAKKKDKDIHAFLNFTEDRALNQAEEIDKKISRGEKLGFLAGVPCSVKDAILVEGAPCTAGSKALEYYIAPYDATVVTKIKDAGAVIIGKTNMDEFGMGASTENSAFGPTKNPHDLTRVSGGSGGGASASVAAGECVIGLGEDTGGSIRLPSSFCGVVGLKPTYGAVSRNGVIALASSLDQVGPVAKTVKDAEILFNVIRGKDELDSTSVDYEIQDTKYKIQDLRIGVPKEYFSKGLDVEVEKIVRNAIEKFEYAGAKIQEMELPHTQYALAAYYIINTSEASANLARYDGMRYGLSVQEGSFLLDAYLDSRGGGLGTEVKRRIILGTYALSAGYYEAYYNKAQKVRTLLKQDFEKAFEKVDIIVGPVSPFLPFKIGERITDPLQMYLVDIYTVPVNLAGLPALSIPAGKVGDLPVGLHMIAPAFEEQRLFETGKLFEQL